MAKRKVVIELEGAAQSTQLAGRLVLASDMHTPVRTNVRTRRTRPATLYLEPEVYVYVFDVKSGQGEFAIRASGAGVGSMTCKTADGTVGRKLDIEVKA